MLVVVPLVNAAQSFAAGVPLVSVTELGSWPAAMVPERFENAGCAQLAFPFVAMPVAKLFVPHCDGVLASAVAELALPETLAAVSVPSTVKLPYTVGFTLSETPAVAGTTGVTGPSLSTTSSTKI